MNELNTEEKIRLILKRRGMTIADLSSAMGQTRQRVHQAFKRGDYEVGWLAKVADAIGCKLEIKFIDKETGEDI